MTLHYITHYTAFENVALHYITHYNTFENVALHYITHYIDLLYITLLITITPIKDEKPQSENIYQECCYTFLTLI